MQGQLHLILVFIKRLHTVLWDRCKAVSGIAATNIVHTFLAAIGELRFPRRRK